MSSSRVVDVYAAIFKAWRIIGGADDVHPMEIMEQIKHVECSPSDYAGLLWDLCDANMPWGIQSHPAVPQGKIAVVFK
jgi:hypothetical protein